MDQQNEKLVRSIEELTRTVIRSTEKADTRGESIRTEMIGIERRLTERQSKLISEVHKKVEQQGRELRSEIAEVRQKPR